jgi:hypothetical protein
VYCTKIIYFEYSHAEVMKPSVERHYGRKFRTYKCKFHNVPVFHHHTVKTRSERRKRNNG